MAITPLPNNYLLDWSDATLKTPIPIAGDTMNSTNTNLSLDGNRVSGWGEGLNEDWLKLLDHLASTTAPSVPTEGQAWFNTSKNTLFVWFTDAWHEIVDSPINGVVPTQSAPIPGDLWFDIVASQLKVYTNGGTWIAVCIQCGTLPTSTPSPTPSPTPTIFTPSPTATPTSPTPPGSLFPNGYGLAWNLTGSPPGPSILSVLISFYSDGTISATNLVSPPNWLTPTMPGAGAFYWVRFSQNTYNTNFFGASLNTWYPLTSTRTLDVRNNVAGAEGYGLINVDISTNGGATVAVTGQFSIDVGNYPAGAGSGGGGSVSVDAFMPLTEKRAGELEEGDPLLLYDAIWKQVKHGTVISNRTSLQRLLTLVSASGIRLTCSDNTPLTLEDGSMINSLGALGQKLPVQDSSGFRWEEIVEVLAAGEGEVATIFCLNQCYAAGDTPNRWIWTHNIGIQKV
jgi:hypothetical protein